MEQKDEKSLLEQIDALKKAIEAAEAKQKPSALKIDDHMELAGKYLNDAAKVALAKKGKNLIEQYNHPVDEPSLDGTQSYVRKVAICHYFTCQVRKDKIEEGVKAISESINILASIGAIHSCLAPVSSVDLAVMPFKHHTSAVICYVHIKPEFIDVAKNTMFNTQEGGIGMALHSLDLELPPGEFFAECHIGHSLTALTPVKSNEARVFDVVGEYMKFLPEGTEFIGYRPTAIISLYAPYELKFRNPLLQRVKRVELEYVREVAFQKEGEKESLKQFNLVTGIRYMGVKDLRDKDGKIEDLYRYSTAL